MALIRNTGGGPENLSVSSVQFSAAGLNSSDVFPVGAFVWGTYQIAWSSVTGAFTAELQVSNDGALWDTVSDSVFTSSGSSGSRSVVMDPLPGKFNRLKITSAAGAGSVDVNAMLKRS
jgi:hypothetical protein